MCNYNFSSDNVTPFLRSIKILSSDTSVSFKTSVACVHVCYHNSPVCTKWPKEQRLKIRVSDLVEEHTTSRGSFTDGKVCRISLKQIYRIRIL